jgi:ABC-type phosphate/phosphonate transport system substrate-binding protein
MRTPLTLSAVVLSGALLAALPAVSKPAPSTVHVGLVDTMFRGESEKQIQSMAGPFKSLMEEQANIVGEVVVSGNAVQVADQLKSGKIDLGVMHGYEFAWALQKDPNLKPLMIAVNHQQFVRAVVVVRESNKTDMAGLQGKSLAVSNLVREHCRLFLDRRFTQGQPLDKWFGKVSTPRTPEDALNDVADDLAVATVVEDVDLDAFRKKFPKTAAKLRVLAESEKFPCPVVVYQDGKPDAEMLKKLRTGMIGAKSTQRGRDLMELCRISGFEAVPADYDKMVADILKAYPPPK